MNACEANKLTKTACHANGIAAASRASRSILTDLRRTVLYPCGMSSLSMCPFCTLPADRPLFRNDAAIVVRDAYPVTPGHTLVIPVRHIASLFDASPSEREGMLALLDLAKQQLQAEFDPAGYNIGINDGAAAGQTIGHLHMHLIPRYLGDTPDPRGGVRWVIPSKADYWTERNQAEPI
jgi:diadenosine tetraphosphate (Ap4A) HIT family hydrolase